MNKRKKFIVILGGISIILGSTFYLNLPKSIWENSIAIQKDDTDISKKDEKIEKTIVSSEPEILTRDEGIVSLEELQRNNWEIDGGPVLSFKPNGEITATFKSGEVELYGTYKFENELIEFEYNIQQELSDKKELVRYYSPEWKDDKMELIPQDGQENVDERTLNLSPVNN